MSSRSLERHTTNGYGFLIPVHNRLNCGRLPRGMIKVLVIHEPRRVKECPKPGKSDITLPPHIICFLIALGEQKTVVWLFAQLFCKNDIPHHFIWWKKSKKKKKVSESRHAIYFWKAGSELYKNMYRKWGVKLYVGGSKPGQSRILQIWRAA